MGDSITVVRDRRYVSFMTSYPNLIPLSAGAVQGIVDAVALATLIVALLIIFIAVVEIDSARDKIRETLVDIKDNEAVVVFGSAIDMLSNVVAVVVAGATYFLLRSRHRALALLSLGGQFAAAIVFTVSTALSLTLVRLASDLAEGGAGGVGEGEILALGRVVATIGEFADFASFTFLGAGLIALGALLLIRSPDGATRAISTVPRWVGGLAVVSGAAMLLVWLTPIDDVLFIFLAIPPGPAA